MKTDEDGAWSVLHINVLVKDSECSCTKFHMISFCVYFMGDLLSRTWQVEIAVNMTDVKNLMWLKYAMLGCSPHALSNISSMLRNKYGQPKCSHRFQSQCVMFINQICRKRLSISMYEVGRMINSWPAHTHSVLSSCRFRHSLVQI